MVHGRGLSGHSHLYMVEFQHGAVGKQWQLIQCVAGEFHNPFLSISTLRGLRLLTLPYEKMQGPKMS